MRTACLPRSLVLVVAIVLALARGAGAAEEKKTEARRLYDEATAAFGVGNYAEAADKYEASFKLHPDAALLYNAAQAYRMAGNQPRALQLYRNFVRLYGDNPRTEDARNHAAALEKAIATGTPAAVPSPPAGTSAKPAMPAPALAPTPPPVVSLGATPPQPSQPPALIEQQASSTGSADEASPSLVRRPWFWVVVGAAVVGGTVAILLATGKDTYPGATLGTLD
jgi:tetratricopeptide (TPR) repeat protein